MGRPGHRWLLTFVTQLALLSSFRRFGLLWGWTQFTRQNAAHGGPGDCEKPLGPERGRNDFATLVPQNRPLLARVQELVATETGS